MPACRPHPLVTTLLAGLLLFVGADCDAKDTAKYPLPTIEMSLGGKTFNVEVADTEATREYGLMRRDSMPAAHGMIFVFPDEKDRGFWMKDTRFALDIVYVNAAGKVVSVKQMKPYDRTTVPSDGPTMYAIELNKWTAEKLGIKAGATIELPPGLKAKN